MRQLTWSKIRIDCIKWQTYDKFLFIEIYGDMLVQDNTSSFSRRIRWCSVCILYLCLKCFWKRARERDRPVILNCNWFAFFSNYSHLYFFKKEQLASAEEWLLYFLMKEMHIVIKAIGILRFGVKFETSSLQNLKMK